MITSKQIKSVAKIERHLYDRCRLYENSNGFRFKFYDVSSMVDLFELKRNFDNSIEFVEYHVEVINDLSSVIIDFFPISKRYGLKLLDQPVNLNEQIREAAYYIAEKRNFATGFEIDDWLEAKREIYQQLEQDDE